MPDLQKPARQMEQRLGEVSRELLRIEAHLRRGESRATAARIDGLRDHLQSVKRELDVPLQLTAVGAQMGALAGGGSWLRGRLPAALLGAVGGWMYGQTLLMSHHREIAELEDHLNYLESELVSLVRGGDEPSSSSASG